MTHQQSLLIGLAGIDGSGKSCQAAMLVKWLKLHGCKVYLAKVEMHATAAVRRLAEVKFGDPQAYLPIPAVLREFAMGCDVLQYYFNVISKKLNQGNVVVWDRGGTLSYRAFCAGFKVQEPWITELYDAIPQPTVNFLIDVPVEESQARLKLRKNTLPEVTEDPGYQLSVRNILLKMARADNNTIVLNGEISRSALQEKIQQHVIPHITGSTQSMGRDMHP